MRFDQRIVMVTGAAGNLGRAVAKAFSERGATLVLLDAKPGDSILQTDLRDARSVQQAIERTLERHGRIDVLCNIAGGFRMGPSVHETPDPDWDFLFDLNAKSVLHMARAVVPAMIRSGSGKSSTSARTLRRGASPRWAPTSHRRAR